jgi:hypothetical protein
MLEIFAAVVEFALRIVLVLGVTGAVVWALAVWMQNNRTLTARRNKVAWEAMKQRIEREIAATSKKR